MALRKWTQTDSARQFAREVADRVIGQIADNRAPWQNGWDKPTGADLPPFNPSNGDRYRQLNEIQLRSVAEQKGFNDPRWMNYRAAMSMGAQVRAGERGTKVEYLRYSTQPEPIHRTYTVFNAEQIDGLPPLEQHLPEEPQQWEVCERAERLLQNAGARFETNNEGWSIYDPDRDTIVMPDKEQFHSHEAYYAAAMHEMSHWTGHENRLDRNSPDNFHVDLKTRAQENLRAHLTCMTVNSKLRLPKESPGSFYHQAWIETIKNNPGELRSAASDADRMADYIQQYDRQPERRQNVDQIPSAERSVDDLPERKPTSEREPYVVHDDSQADHTEALRDMPKPWLSYPHGASGAFPKPSKDRDDVDLSR